MIEHNIIKCLLDKETYQNYRQYVSFDIKELQDILNALDSWWVSHEENPTVDDLELHFRASHVNLTDKKYALYKNVFQTIREAVASKESVVSLFQALHRKSSLIKLAETALQEADQSSVEDGESKLPDILKEVLQLSNTSGESIPDASEFVSDDLVELKEHTIAKPGLRWRLKILNMALGSLRKGDFGFIFARPETGKTTFLASEVVFMAIQAEAPVLWFNNEEQGEKVMVKCYQSAFGVEIGELFAKPEEYKEKFTTLVKGNLKLYDTALIHKKQVEALCKKYKPSLIVFDQIDKIKGFDDDREDLRLGAIYQWARELAKEYAPVIGVCQADGTGEGQKWLSMANVANAKTAKQAEADWILGIGKTYKEDEADIRYLNVTKNKLLGDEDTKPELRHLKDSVIIRPEIGRYEDTL